MRLTEFNLTLLGLLLDDDDFGDLPMRVVRVDETRAERLMVEGVEVIDGEVVIIVDKHA